MATTIEKPVREQNLALRVMRLSRPRFNEVVPLVYDPVDPTSMAIVKSAGPEHSSTGNGVPVDSFLIAPHTMRDVYLGESFTFYISIINIGSYQCKEISIKADVQTQTQRLSIGEASFDEIALASNQQIGKVFTHEIQELGQHILVCTVSYRAAGGEALNLKKFFKFPVNKPIEVVKQNFYECKNDVCYLEAQIQNLCTNAIYIESMSLEVKASNSSSPGQCLPEKNSGFLAPMSTRQYLFKLGDGSKNVSTGIFTILWRTTMGDRGRIQMDTAHRMKPAGHGTPLLFAIERMPRRLKKDEPFSADCAVKNFGELPLDLLLSFDQSRQPSIVHCSISGQRLPTINPNCSFEFSLDFLPFVHGLQQISGIRITDLQSRRTHEFDDIEHVFVY